MSMSKPNQPKLYNGQPDLFGAPSPRSYAPTPEKARAEILKVLDQARTATVMPWPADKVGYWKIVFPQMTNWLPPEEAAQLRFAFEQEIRRLEAA